VTWLILGTSLVVGGLLLLRWFVGADPETIIRILRWTGLGFAILVALFLMISGRFSLLWIAVLGLLPWISRFRMLQRLARSARGPSRGRQSRVDTRFVAMSLDHDSGDMEGEVIEGRFTGRRISDMPLDDVLELLAEASADPQSGSVIQAYLDKMHGDTWRERAEAGGQHYSASPAAGPMTAEEAYRVLGLEPGATDEDIRRSHRDLMKRMHPDHGGSDYLAAKINEAKETLLGDVS
jgi:hypothetical protein